VLPSVDSAKGAILCTTVCFVPGILSRSLRHMYLKLV